MTKRAVGHSFSIAKGKATTPGATQAFVTTWPCAVQHASWHHRVQGGGGGGWYCCASSSSTSNPKAPIAYLSMSGWSSCESPNASTYRPLPS
jgi:hypothetical protein